MSMQYTHLGRSGLLVSRLCLGTMNFGPNTSEEDSYRIMDRALDLGINFFDTANVYGWVKGEGITEQIIGRWWAQGGGRREKVVIATKVYGVMGDWPNESRLSALHIKRACEASLRRLKTDYIDLYQMHHIDRECPWEEIWQAMEQLYREGKILYVGSSNFAGWHIAQAQELAKQRHFMGLVSEQSLYNLNARMIELEVVPACLHYGVGIIPWSPLASGLLGGILKGVQEGRRASEGVQTADWRSTATASNATRRSARSWARSLRMSRWRGYCTSPL
jgi:aryl-alcohol dehydrogenase-like predicted oxidoreductase